MEKNQDHVQELKNSLKYFENLEYEGSKGYTKEIEELENLLYDFYQYDED